MTRYYLSAALGFVDRLSGDLFVVYMFAYGMSILCNEFLVLFYHFF